MPQITVKGFTDSQMKTVTPALSQKLSSAIGCPEDWLIFELVPTTFYAGGQQTAGFPIIEVSWFDRADNVREEVAGILRDTAFELGYSLVQVIFTTLQPARFYEFEA